MLDYALGLDCSHWQGRMNWQTAVNAGASFAFIRAGSHDASGPYTDWQFENNKNAGALLPVGFYWYWRPQYSNDAQATHFHNLVKDTNWYLPPVIDVEDRGSMTASAVANRLEEFIDKISVLFERWPIIYTRQSFFDPYVASRLLWSQLDLWAARYERFLSGPWEDGKYEFRDWNDWRFWQFSADKDYNGEGQPVGNFRGAEFGAESTHIDINYWNGDIASLQSYAGIEDTQMEERIAELERLVAELFAERDAQRDYNAKTNTRLNNQGKVIAELQAALPADLAARLEALEKIHAAERAALLAKIGGA